MGSEPSRETGGAVQRDPQREKEIGLNAAETHSGDRSSTFRVGAVCAIAAGILTATAAITYLMLPSAQRVAVKGAELLPSVAADPGLLKAEFWQLALVGIAGLGLVPALSRLVADQSPGLVRWFANIALVGYAVTAVSYFFTLGRLPQIATAYVAGDGSTQAALLATWRSSLDLQAFWQFVAVGLFILLVSVLALRSRHLPAALCYLGVALGILHFLAPLGVGMSDASFITGVVAIAIVLAPIWYVWTGVALWRLADQET